VTEPDPHALSGKTPEIEYGRTRINWVALAAMVALVIGLWFISWSAALVGALVIALLVVVNQTGTGNWIHGSIGNDTQAARPPRRNRPDDY
jgi:hypothetical protein